MRAAQRRRDARRHSGCGTRAAARGRSRRSRGSPRSGPRTASIIASVSSPASADGESREGADRVGLRPAGDLCKRLGDAVGERGGRRPLPRGMADLHAERSATRRNPSAASVTREVAEIGRQSSAGAMASRSRPARAGGAWNAARRDMKSPRHLDPISASTGSGSSITSAERAAVE